MRYRWIIVLTLSLVLGGCGEDSTFYSPPKNPESEPFYAQQWYLKGSEEFIQEEGLSPDAHIHPGDLLSRYDGSGVTVAIIDGGLDQTHEELQKIRIVGYDVATGKEDISPADSTDYHGTAVTGIIAAQRNGKGIAGIASGAKIVFLKYKREMSDGETIALFEKAEELGADIVTCCWGTYHVSKAVKDYIVHLAREGRHGKGTLIVFAAGNDDREMGNDESAIPEVIAVGASDGTNHRAWYSNFGPNLDILAPGGDYGLGVTTLDLSGEMGISTENPDYLLFDDPNAFIATSPAAAIVSGALALLLQKYPEITREEVERILHDSADKIGEIPYDERGRNDYYGWGKLNLKRLFLSAQTLRR